MVLCEVIWYVTLTIQGNGFTTDISGGYANGSTYCVLLNKVRMLEGIAKDKELQISARKAILT